MSVVLRDDARVAGRPASRAAQAVVALVLVLGGAVVGFLRNADPVLNPVLYAEDAAWTSLLLDEGFLFTALNAREGFPVLGLAAMQELGLLVTQLLHGDDLSTLPIAYAVISYLFVALVATLPLLLLRDVLPVPAALTLYAGTLLMPLGDAGNEVVGRILNLGFLAPVVAAYLVAWLLLRPRGTVGTLLCALALLVCAMTLPVALGVVALGAGLLGLQALFRVRHDGTGLRGLASGRGRSPATGAVALTAAFAVGVLTLPSDVLTAKGGGTALSVVPGGFIEYLGARSLLYPLVAWGYGRLSDPVVVVGVLAAATLVVVGLVRCRSAPGRLALLVLAASAGLTVAGLGLERAELTAYLDGSYTGTFPDRYFYGVNIAALGALLAAASQLGRPRGNRDGDGKDGGGAAGQRRLPAALSSALSASPPTLVASAVVLVALALSLPTTIDLNRPDLAYRDLGTLEAATAAELCPGTERLPDTELDPATEPDTVTVPAYPVLPTLAWRVVLPREVAVATGSRLATCPVEAVSR